MTTTFGVRENKNWYRATGKNKQNLRFEVVQYDDREYSSVNATAATREEAAEIASQMQADEDAGVTIGGMPADDHHAIEAGMATALVAYYEALPELTRIHGIEDAKAHHPWRMGEVTIHG